ncbi:hypothetical protein [Paracoccus onubensis]|uniref:Uncharacterized protein n=1 Tax=Paracoccus onubensis TaxID=1675788 RepID=A0A418SN32_9RHOB|nr:hypothetical protein [Paracoccus onubensis]RJE82371.1 hypothetical protein D3P04_19735 [Paracoccus onubensis]
MAKDEQVERGRAGDMPMGERLFRVCQLLDAIEACKWEDTEPVIVAILEEARIGAPDVPFGDVEADADFWAGLATYEELRAYFIASGRKLVNQQLGQRGRMRLIKCILASMSADERREAFRYLNPSSPF